MSKHYICGIDFEEELENGTADHFTSIEDLKDKKLCWRSCGIIEIELDEFAHIVGSKIVSDPQDLRLYRGRKGESDPQSQT